MSSGAGGTLHIGPLRRSIRLWLLGRGFLTAHVGIYLIVATGLLLYNLARSPTDLWVQQPLRRWGAVVSVHALLVFAGWAIWAGKYRLNRRPASAAALSSSPALGSGLGSDEMPSRFSGRFSRYRISEPAPVGPDARQFSTRVRDKLGTLRQRPQVNAATPVADARAGAPPAPALRERGAALMSSGLSRATDFAERGRAVAKSTIAHARGITPAASWPSQQDWDTSGSARDKRPEWSAPPQRPDPISATHEGTSRPDTSSPQDSRPQSPGAWSPRSVPLSVFPVSSPPSNGEVAKPARLSPMPPPASPPPAAQPSPASGDERQWSWVETAAATWLARRETDETDETPVEPAPRKGDNERATDHPPTVSPPADDAPGP